MKVLQINSVCGYGSTGRIVVDLYHALARQGHECCVAYGRGIAPPEIKTIKIGNKLDFYFHALQTRLLDCHGFGSKRATRELIKKIEEFSPDIIHLHNVHGYYINIEILFEYLRNIDKPVVWTLHDCWSFTGHCAHFDNIGCESWKKGCKSCKQKTVYPQSWLYDNSKKNYKKKKELISAVKKLTIVVPSQWLKERVKESFLKGYSVIVINNGIALEQFAVYGDEERQQIKNKLLKRYQIPSDKILCLGVASKWSRDKGLDDFIKMSKLGGDLHYVLVGVNEKQKKLLLPGITGIERTENVQELVDLYNSVEVFLNPTYADTYPTVNLEARACGLPVISYRTGGSTETSDITVEKGNFVEMVSMIYKIFQKPVVRNEKIDLKTLDQTSCYEKYLKVYEEMAEL